MQVDPTGEMTRRRNRNRSKQRTRRSHRRRKEAKPRQPTQPRQDQRSGGSEMWIDTYRSLFEWHHNQVRRLCPQIRQEEDHQDQDQDNEEVLEAGTSHCLDYVYESSSSEDEPAIESEPEPVDEEYLKFLEVTIKHQEELKQRRLAAAVSTTSLDNV
ncbi:hypothetical protein KR009_000829 [Drosophila setifemur]|nr:hypothetical protein KR009_000829 [Drosophila setifemur]